MAASTGTFGVDAYVTSNTEYSGSLSGLGMKIDGPSGGVGGWGTVSGYDYGFIKYDGPNAGYVLFYLGGAQANSLIPDYPANLWTTNSTKFEVSGITFFNQRGSTNEQIPDTGSSVGLFVVGLTLLAIARRKLA